MPIAACWRGTVPDPQTAPPMAKGKTRRPPRPAGRQRRSPAAAQAPALNIRVDLGQEVALGPGKVRLMELIAEHGSISAAGRAMGMSYRRAWLLVDSLNKAFRAPLVASRAGGRKGGGAGLTALGKSVVDHYRAIEAETTASARASLRALADAIAAKRP
jgi:molybdate transport system regulatory protein